MCRLRLEEQTQRAKQACLAREVQYLRSLQASQARADVFPSWGNVMTCYLSLAGIYNRVLQRDCISVLVAHGRITDTSNDDLQF